MNANRASTRWVGVLAAACLACCAQHAARAGGLSDPMRPPGFLSGDTAPRLEAVILLPGYKAAVIDGHTVLLGGRLDDARLVRLEPDAAILRADGRNLRLTLPAATASAGAER